MQLFSFAAYSDFCSTKLMATWSFCVKSCTNVVAKVAPRQDPFIAGCTICAPAAPDNMEMHCHGKRKTLKQNALKCINELRILK